MTWQDELRKLDEDFNAGRVSASDYRVRRDTLLDKAASEDAPAEPTAQPSPSSSQPPTPLAPPVMPAASEEQTQFLRPITSTESENGNDNGSTNLVDQPWSVPGSPESLSAVPVGPQPNQQGPVWTGSPSEQDEAPPWSGSEFPPLSSVQQGQWFAQGPEGPAPKRGKGKVFATIGVVVLVAAVVVALLIFKPFNSAPSQAASPTTSTSTPSSSGPLAVIPGLSQPNTVHTFADIPAYNFLSPEELSDYQHAGASDTYFSFTTNGQNQVVMLVVKVSSPQAASSLANQLASLELKYGMSAIVGTNANIFAQTIDNVNGIMLRRAEYASGSYVARIEIRGHDTAASADQELNVAIQAQLSKLPANG